MLLSTPKTPVEKRKTARTIKSSRSAEPNHPTKALGITTWRINSRAPRNRSGAKTATQRRRLRFKPWWDIVVLITSIASGTAFLRRGAAVGARAPPRAMARGSCRYPRGVWLVDGGFRRQRCAAPEAAKEAGP